MNERMYNAIISFGNVVKESAVAVQAGIWNVDGKPVKRTLIETMSQTIAHCGPDGEEIHVEPNIAMLYRPFHTTPESRRERQPYRFGGNQVITWDGRLDNRELLRAQLRNDLEDDPTDVAIVAAGFQRWGCAVFEKLIGDWALAIWNAHSQELILARDFLGVRHIYFYTESASIAWSTHLDSLLKCADRFTLCHDYIASYFTQWPDTCLTQYSEIRAVAPASFMVVRPQHTETHRYWEFRPQVKLRYKHDREYEEHFCFLFRQSVRSRLRSDSPILAHLSGGLDSSSIVCMADDILAEEPTTATRIDTFSFYDPAEPGEEDYKYWTAVEEKRGGRGHHAELRASGDTFSLARAASAVTPGFGIREELKTAECEVIRNGNYRVVLSGAGGDQMLGQTIDPAVPIAELLICFQPRSALRELTAWSLKTRRPLLQIFTQSLALLFPTRLRARFTPASGLQPWLTAHFADKYRIIDRLLPASEGAWHWTPGNRAFDQALKECAGFVASIPAAVEEVRYPFLDRRLVEFLAAIPTDQMMRSGERRSIMRRGLANILPKEILSRQTKSSTGRCDVLTLRKHWTKIQETLDSLLTAKAGYLDPNRFAAALSAFARGSIPPYDGQLLRGLALEFWLKDKLAQGIIHIPAL